MKKFILIIGLVLMIGLVGVASAEECEWGESDAGTCCWPPWFDILQPGCGNNVPIFNPRPVIHPDVPGGNPGGGGHEWTYPITRIRDDGLFRFDKGVGGDTSGPEWWSGHGSAGFDRVNHNFEDIFNRIVMADIPVEDEVPIDEEDVDSVNPCESRTCSRDNGNCGSGCECVSTQTGYGCYPIARLSPPQETWWEKLLRWLGF